ncbi:MAG: transketolase [Gemmatimonadota bacterium]
MDSIPDASVAQRSIDTIRALAMDAVQKADSGHPGTPMALAPVAYLLWTRYLRHNPANPAWPDRDRFVLSCGHASMLLYSLLHLTGYDVSMEDLEQFRQLHSRTPGHPERGFTAGVEVTTGPLGQGVGNSVGLAIAERFLAARFNRDGMPLVHHRVWTLASDGDMMEGVASEAASIAGHLQLGNLKVIYDDNHITIDGHTNISFSEDVGKRFEAYGWRVLHVEDGNDLAALATALETAREETARPVLVRVRTIIGWPAPTKRDTPEAHGAPLGEEEVRRTKEIMGWKEPPFTVPAHVRAHMLEVKDRGEDLETAWNTLMEEYGKANPDLAREFRSWMSEELPKGWSDAVPTFTPKDGKLATRQASQTVLNALAQKIPNLLGGSADLATSNGTIMKGLGDFEATTFGRNLHFGVREHGMGSCCNGIAAHGGLRPFAGTFLIFFDYMKPAIRLAAFSKLPVIFIGTHDSIGLGEDGPTHQPIEQLAMLRAIPELVTLRPADATETAEAWRIAMERKEGPTVLVLTRQKLPVLDRTTLASQSDVRRGGYVLFDPPGGFQAILMATGSEVHLALDSAKLLLEQGTRVRVVSLPSWELFEAQTEEYRESVLPRAIAARVAIEAASGFGWERYLGTRGAMVGMRGFGASAPAEVLFQHFGFTTEHVIETMKGVMEKIR